MMLEPFRIRNLGDDVSEPCQNDAASSSRGIHSIYPSRREGTNHLGSLAQVTANQYNDMISKNPRSKLSYMDDEDGEIITVGSSSELAQRLDEPATQYDSSQDPVPRHIFDIRRTKSVLELWQGIHKKTMIDAELYDASPPPSVIDLSSHDPKAQAECHEDAFPALDNEKEKDPLRCDNEVHESWVRFCDPPRTSPSPVATLDALKKAAMRQIDDNARSRLAGDDESLLSLVPPSKSVSATRLPMHLTEEGQRQALEAGVKLRNARSFNTNDRASSPLIPAFTTNPWASYSNLGLLPNPQTEREPASNESPVQEKNRPLFSNFESELTRMMKESLADPLPDDKKGKVVETVSATAEAAPKLADSGADSDSEKTKPATAVPAGSQSSHHKATSQPTSSPPDVLGTTINAIFAGVSRLTSELRSKLPEFEQRLSDLHQQLPSQVESAVQGAINSVGAQINVLANAMQDAAVSAREAADNRRDTEIQAAEQLIGVLRDLAGEFGDMGRTLFAAFEAQTASGGTTQQETTDKNLGVDDRRGTTETVAKNVASGTEEPASKYEGPFIVHSSSISSTSAKYPGRPGEAMLKPVAGLEGAEEQPSNSNSKEQPSKEKQSEAPQTSNNPADVFQWPDGKRHTIFITNLDPQVTEMDITDALTKNGFLGQVKLPKNAFSVGHKGFCYILFPSIHAAKGARDALQGMPLYYRRLCVDLRTAPSQRSSDGLEDQKPYDVQTPDAVSSAAPQAATSSTYPYSFHDGFLDPNEFQESPWQTPKAAPFTDLDNYNSGVRRAKSLSPLRLTQVGEAASHSSHNEKELRESSKDGAAPERTRQRHREHAKESLDLGFKFPAATNPDHDLAWRHTSPLPRESQCPADSKGEWDQSPHMLKSVNFTDPDLRDPDPVTASPTIPNINNDPQLGQSPYLPSLSLRQLTRKPRADSMWDLRRQPQANNMHTRLRANTTAMVAGPSIRKPAPPVPPPRRHQHYAGPLARSHTERHHHPRRNHGSQHAGELYPNTPGSFPIEYPRVTAPRAPPIFTTETDAAQGGFLNEIEKCAKHLETLGFGNATGRDSRRLRVYAEAAHGNLEEAIEMIEEERKAYELQRPDL